MKNKNKFLMYSSLFILFGLIGVIYAFTQKYTVIAGIISIQIIFGVLMLLHTDDKND
jgi:hypothetical protein